MQKKGRKDEKRVNILVLKSQLSIEVKYVVNKFNSVFSTLKSSNKKLLKLILIISILWRISFIQINSL